MTPADLNRLAEAIDPDAWGALLGKKSYYYRRRRFLSLRAAERCAALINGSAQPEASEIAT